MKTAARCVWLLWVISTGSAFGQSELDSVRMLPEFIIQQSRLDEYGHNGFELEPDSTTRRIYEGQSLARLLKGQGLALVRSYSPGGLATASIRGAGSSHTAVLWHGINIESPMNAQADLAQVPIGLFNQVSIQSGGNSATYGSGSIGGTIQFGRQAQFNKGWQTRLTGQAGSFGQVGTTATVNYSNAVVDVGGGLSVTNSDNDFTYPSQLKGGESTWQHARQEIAGFNQHINWRLTPEHLIYSRIWYQHNSSQVPNPSSVARPGSALQEDRAIRTLLGYLFTRNRFELRYQGAFMYHDMDYTDSLISVSSTNTANSFIQQLEGSWKISASSQLTSSVQYLHEKAGTNNYGEQAPRRNRISMSGFYRFAPSSNWSVTAGLREEVVDGEFTPLSPFVNGELSIRNDLRLNISFNRNFRIPSFNDLYWLGAGGRGNPELMAETSLGGEAGLQWTRQQFSSGITGYSQHVDNWIQWIPVQSQVWSPVNVKQVWLRGLETQAGWHDQFNELKLKIQGIYRFTKATNSRVYDDDNPQHQDKQLMLTPLHSGSVILEAECHNFTLLSSTAFTGKQYPDSDNTDFRQMDAYVTSDIWLQKKWTVHKSILALSGSINNLFNSVYVARPGYPMPGRNYMLRIIYEFNQL